MQQEAAQHLIFSFFDEGILQSKCTAINERKKERNQQQQQQQNNDVQKYNSDRIMEPFGALPLILAVVKFGNCAVVKYKNVETYLIEGSLYVGWALLLRFYNS